MGTLEQQLAASVAYVRERKRQQHDDLDEWLDAVPPPPKRPKRLKGKKMTQAIQKAESEHLAPVRYVERDELAAWRAMREQAKELVQSGFLPRAVNTPEKAMAIIQTGKELGLGPMQALRSIHIIEGKPTMSADLIAGLALARLPGSVLRVAESSDKQCVIEAARAGQQLTRFTYTMADAQRAGLAGKDNWKKHPRAMLRARAITEAARAIFPDTCVGIYDPDELGAVTTPTGEIVVEQLPTIGPNHGPGEDPAAPDQVSDEFNDIMGTLGSADRYAFNPACTWEEMTRWRSIIGSKAAPSELGKRLSALWHGDTISPGQKKEMGALWNRIDRKLTQLEGKLRPPPIEASFTDEPEDGTEALGAPEREPGEDDD